MRRKKYPQNHALRKKLIICMARDAKSSEEIGLFLGYSLSREQKHLMQEHPEMLTDEFWKLYQDDSYREKSVQELLKKYEAQMTSISTSFF